MNNEVIIHRIETNQLGHAGFIVSLVSVLCLGWLSPIALVMSIVALAKRPRGYAIAGTILGGIGSLWIFFFGLVIWAALVAASKSITSPKHDEYISPTPVFEPTVENEWPKGIDRPTITKPNAEPAVETFRSWTSNDSKFTTWAKLVSATETEAVIEKPDGKSKAVLLAKLCEFDRQYVHRWLEKNKTSN